MQKKSLSVIIGTVLCVLFAILCILPLVYMVLVSFTQSESLYFRFSDIRLDFGNYEYVLVKRGFLQAFWNSVVTVVGSCLLVDVVSAMAAYGFAKKPLPWKDKIFSTYIATMAIPGQVVLIPMFIIVNELQLTNTYSALILPMIGAFGIFLMRQFMDSVPTELIEASEIEGSGEIRTFVTIVLPLSQPALITLTVFTCNSAWNNFLWPLLVNTRSTMYPLTVAMSTLSSINETNYGLVMAGATLTFLVPFIVYIFLQKQFVEGIAMGGVKG